jgi:adenylate cyclase
LIKLRNYLQFLDFWHQVFCYQASHIRVVQAMNIEHKRLSLINGVLAHPDIKNDHQYEPKLHQIKGDLLLMQALPDEAFAIAQREAEACFRRAIEIAQSQQAKLWEARALASLCRLLHSQGRDEGCHQQLAEWYAWFSEGFETEDLRVVRAVLDKID